jgi:hypothetical protein
LKEQKQKPLKGNYPLRSAEDGGLKKMRLNEDEKEGLRHRRPLFSIADGRKRRRRASAPGIVGGWLKGESCVEVSE